MNARRLELLAFIRQRIAATGLSPTYSEIGKRFRCGRSNAFRIVERLIEEGHLLRTADRWRKLVPAADVPIVVVRHLVGGGTEYLAFAGAPVRLLVVDEACPSDRVYEVTDRSPPSLLAELVQAGSPIGSRHDDRHEALSRRILAAGEGRPHLEAVR